MYSNTPAHPRTKQATVMKQQRTNAPRWNVQVPKHTGIAQGSLCEIWEKGKFIPKFVKSDNLAFYAKKSLYENHEFHLAWHGIGKGILAVH